MYDSDSLTRLLDLAGFRNVERKKFREGGVPDLDILDVFPEISIYLEARKEKE
jgi:hypothetical protein